MANSWASIFGPAGKAIVDNVTKKPSVDNSFLQNPEYPHSQDARDLWWSKLQDFGNDPNYGAVTPDWSNIWETVQNRVKQYYEGGPLTPGVKDRVKSALARRGMSDNPASDYLLAQVDAQQGGDLRQIATDQGMGQANLAEQGRQTWLGSLQNFQAQKPAGEWQTLYKDNKNPLTSFLTDLGIQAGTAYLTGGVSAAGGGAQNNYLSSMLKNQQGPQSYAPMSAIGMNAGPYGNRKF